MIFSFRLFQEIKKKWKEDKVSKIGLIISREYSSRVKTKSFVILTFLVPILVGGLAFFGMWVGMKQQKHLKVLVADPRNLCEAKVFIDPNEKPPATFYFTEELVLIEEFESATKYEEYDMLIAIDPDVITNRTINAASREEPSEKAKSFLAKKLESRLEEYYALDEGIPIDKYHKIRQSYSFKVSDLKGQDFDDCEVQDVAQAVGMGFSFAIFLFLMLYGGLLMRSVLEEKTSRVVEIIVSSVKPFELMMGKLLAVGLVGLTQFAIWFILIIGIMMAIQPFFAGEIDPTMIADMTTGLHAPTVDNLAVGTDNCVQEAIYNFINWPVLMVLFVIYFIGGYLLYGSLFAIVGAASDSEADTQQLMIPVLIPLMFVYFLSFSIIGNADGAAAIWGSQIPFSSPIIMLQRVATGTVGIWEVVISLILLTGTFILTTYLAGKVYRVGILLYGKKASWREIIKWIRH
jgi:ABC-2 type transport system permease protein